MVCYWELARSDCHCCHNGSLPLHRDTPGKLFRWRGGSAGRHLPSREAVATVRNTRITQTREPAAPARTGIAQVILVFAEAGNICCRQWRLSELRLPAPAPSLCHLHRPAGSPGAPAVFTVGKLCPLGGSLSTPARRHMYPDNSERSLM